MQFRSLPCNAARKSKGDCRATENGEQEARAQYDHIKRELEAVDKK